jgi:putative phage-type endonuclease
MQEKIDYLLANYGIDDQRTQAWFTKRGEMLTASEIWKSFGDATASARRELILSKLTPPKKQDGQGVGALIWGTRFEPIAKEIYCHTEKVKLVDLSCVRHPEHAFLGASPDGLILTSDERNGRLIELKCPISRPFNNDTPVPDAYYHQMQLQMECTGLVECDYVEMQFKLMNYSEWSIAQAEFKSCFAVDSEANVKYRHILDPRTVHDWQVDILTNPMNWQILYWVLVQKRQKLTLKDADWMPTHFPEMKATWDEIVQHRQAGTVPAVKDKPILVL